MESIIVPSKDSDKKQKYESLLPQIKALTEGESDATANLCNLMAALKQGMDFFWVGIYLVRNNELVVGPFQGTVACTRIAYGKGVCGTSWEQAKTIIVDDVDKFPGHIACSSDSRSEITIPVFKENKVIAILDVDSAALNDFDQTDAHYLEQVCTLISSWL